VFAPEVTILQSPFLPRAAGSTAFDHEGVATQDRVLVDAGVLRGYVLSSYSARKLKLATTGNAGGVFNVVVPPTAGSFESLLKAMHEGLLVTEVMGQGVNPVTGDYSRGASGFWVRNGVIDHPVQEVTVAGRLQDMFQGIRGIGSDVDLRGGVRCGSVLIDAMTIAGMPGEEG
jgi:PmbA protein